MPSLDYQPGTAIPGTVYQVVRLIGAGGMGTVYDVEDTTIGKRYVLKTLHPQLGARDDLARRMQTEARTLARLNHPNIVEVITAGVTADDLKLPYYVMERLNGQSLRVVLSKKGRLDLSYAFHIGIDLLDALDHAHDKGVIHRDVKPDNVFLHRTPVGVTLTKLLDFGIVSMLDGGGETAGRFLGTLRYAAPEQLRGEKPTPKTDLYSAGLVLYEILAGRGPFDDEGEPRRIGAAHLRRAPPPVSRFASVPPSLDSLISAALSKVPDARPRDAFSFAASLRNLRRVEQGRASAKDRSESRETTPVVADARHPSGPDPGTAASTAHVLASVASTALPKTTLRGMAPPTEAPSEPAAGLATTVRVKIDRAAATQSLAPLGANGPAVDTEALWPSEPFATIGASTASASRATTVRPSSSPDWGEERVFVRSEGPQVRSLLASRGKPRGPWPAVAAVALGLAGTLALAIVSFAVRAGPVMAPAGAGEPVDAPRGAGLVGSGPPAHLAVTPPPPTSASAILDEGTSSGQANASGATSAPEAKAPPSGADGALNKEALSGPSSPSNAGPPRSLPNVGAHPRTPKVLKPARDRPGPGF